MHPLQTVQIWRMVPGMCQEKPAWLKKKKGEQCKKSKECKSGLLCVNQKCTFFAQKEKLVCVTTRNTYLRRFMRACENDRPHRDYGRAACLRFAKLLSCGPKTCKRAKCPSAKKSNKNIFLVGILYIIKLFDTRLVTQNVLFFFLKMP